MANEQPKPRVQPNEHSKPRSGKSPSEWQTQVTNTAVVKGPDPSIDWLTPPIPKNHIRVIVMSHKIGEGWVYVDKYVGGDNGEGITSAYQAKADDPHNFRFWKVIKP